MISDYTTLRSQLDIDGYARLPQLFGASELSDAQLETAGLMAAWQAGQGGPDYWTARSESAAREILYRIHNLERKSAAVRRILASERLRSPVEAIVGVCARPTACALTIKLAGEGLAVPWHRDPIEVPSGRIFNFSIYLDRSTPDNGCFAVVPRSHRLPRADLGRLDLKTASVLVDAEVGDVIVHDVQTFHGSAPCRNNLLRRAIVTEFQPPIHGRRGQGASSYEAGVSA